MNPTTPPEQIESRKCVSFILPVYNGEKFLETAVRSVLEIDDPELELLIIDDGSTDGTAEISDVLARADDRIRVFHGNNIGQGASRNRGIEAAEGRYLAFIDADDELIPDNMMKMMLLAADERFDVLCGNYENTTGSKSRLATCGVPSGEVLRSCIPGTVYQHIKNEGAFCYCWNKLYKRSFLLENNLRFPEEKDFFMEDALFNLMVFAERPTYYYLNAPVYKYYIRTDSASHRKNEELSSKAITMLGTYEKFLKRTGCLDDNMDLYVPLAFRQFCWCMYNEALWSCGDQKQVEEKCRLFLIAPCFEDAVNRESRKYLRSVTSLPQRILFGYCYHELKQGHVKRLGWVFCRMYRLMQFYDRHCRVGTGDANDQRCRSGI